MPRQIEFSITVGDWRKVRKHLAEPDSLVGGPWKAALEAAANLVAAEAKTRAPKKSGTLQASITTAYQARPIPLWGKVTANTGAKFRYGWALNFAKKRQYHYRSTGRMGQLTLGWFTNAMGAMRDKVNALLERAAAEVERRWGGV